MSFNGGGTNVQGVNSREPGTLKLSSTSSTFSVAGGETNYVDYTVPANKIWILKSVSSSAGNFVGTLSSNTFYLYDGVTLASLQGQTTTAATLILPQAITMPAGFKIRIRLVTNAWTSGQMLTYLGVQELDA